MVTAYKALLTKEDFEIRGDLPEWLLKEYATFHNTITDKTFPCYFGMSGELKGELRYGYMSQDDWSSLPVIVKEFLSLFNDSKHKRHGLFVFVEPFETEGSLEQYRDEFWAILQYLHNMDEMEWPLYKIFVSARFKYKSRYYVPEQNQNEVTDGEEQRCAPASLRCRDRSTGFLKR